MKKFLISLCSLMMLFSPVTVFAEGENNFANENFIENISLYYETRTVSSSGTETKFCFSLDTVLDSPVDLCMVKTGSKDNDTYFIYEPYIYYPVPGSLSKYSNSFKIECVPYTLSSGEWVAGGKMLYNFSELGLRVKDYVATNGTTYCSYNVLQANFPFFDSLTDAENYFMYGSSSGIINKPDYENISTNDDTFKLTGFFADNTITASWTGTTHDDKSEEYAEMFVELTAGYAYIDAPEQVVTTEPYVGEYDIADKTFTKYRSELEVTDETLFLRCLKVTPYYKYESGWLSTPYKGVPCYVYLNPDGTLDYVESDATVEDNYVAEDVGFYLRNITATYTGASYMFGESEKMIHWSGTSKNELMKTIPPEDTLVVVCFVGYDENLDTKIFSYEELYEYVLGSAPDDIRIKQGWYTTTNSFTFFTEDAFEMLESQGYTFDGEVLLYPFYKLDGVLYEGRCSVVNVVNGEIKDIVTDEDGNQEEIIIKPPVTDEDGSTSGGGNDFYLEDISDAPSYMLNLLKAFMSLVGAVPNLLAAIFPFLPIEIVYLLASGLVIALILRIIGR